jgi:hypothetical protein
MKLEKQKTMKGIVIYFKEQHFVSDRDNSLAQPSSSGASSTIVFL